MKRQVPRSVPPSPSRGLHGRPTVKCPTNNQQLWPGSAEADSSLPHQSSRFATILFCCWSAAFEGHLEGTISSSIIAAPLWTQVSHNSI